MLSEGGHSTPNFPHFACSKGEVVLQRFNLGRGGGVIVIPGYGHGASRLIKGER